MKCLVKEGKYSTMLRVGDIKLLPFLQTPSNLPKEKLPLWRFITYKHGFDRLVINQDNYDTIHMLIIEFDNGTTIQAVEALASDYSYAIHTTSNHSKNLHKFRLMLPLDKSYPEALWRDDKHVKQAMAKLFPALDESCFRNFQCIPALPSNPEDYYYNVNQGRKFSYSDIADIVNSLKLDDEINRQFQESQFPVAFLKNRDIEFNLDSYIDNYVIGRLDEIDWNCKGCGRNDAMVSLCGTWKAKAKHEGSWILSAILSAVESYHLPAEFAKIARKKLR